MMCRFVFPWVLITAHTMTEPLPKQSCSAKHAGAKHSFGLLQTLARLSVKFWIFSEDDWGPIINCPCDMSLCPLQTLLNMALCQWNTNCWLPWPHPSIMQPVSNSLCAYMHTSCILDVVMLGCSIRELLAPGLKDNKSVLGWSCWTFPTSGMVLQNISSHLESVPHPGNNALRLPKDTGNMLLWIASLQHSNTPVHLTFTETTSNLSICHSLLISNTALQ